MAFNNSWNNWWKNRWFALNGTYYFDTVNGSDSNNGTTPNTPWQSQSKAEDVALSAGQSIYRKVDGEWVPFRAFSSAATTKYVHGYYQGVYAAGPNPIPLPVSGIQWSALTHIAHDHVRPNSDGTLDFTTYTIDSSASSALISAAHTNGVRCTCVISDVSFDGLFPSMVAAAANHLSTLIDNILDLVITRGYDGIDIDWETGATFSRVRDFMTSFYPAMKAQNPNFIVSMANGSGSLSGADGSYSWVPVTDFSDYWTVMCYGSYLIGGFYTWFNDPLFDGSVYTTSGRLETSANHTFNSFLKLGVPPVHMMHGMPFYGGGLSGNVSPVGQSGSGPNAARQYYTTYDAPSQSGANQLYLPYNTMQGSFSVSSGSTLWPSGHTWTISPTGTHWDDTTLCPWLAVVDPSDSFNDCYVTYDDPGSVVAKAQYGIAKDLLGASIWEISGDYISGRTNHKTPLMNALSEALPKTAFPTVTPDVPVNLSIADVSGSNVTINWPTIDNARKYNIKRSTTSGSGYSTLATLNAPNYADTSVSSGTTYYYVVSSLSYDGTESSNSAEVSVTASTIPAVTNLLTSPTDITNAAWTISGTGTSANASITNATTIQTADTVETDFSQFVSGLNPSTDYVATIVLKLTSGAAFGSFNIFTPSFSASIATNNQPLVLNVPVTYTISFNSDVNFNVWFEMIFPVQTTPVSATIVVTNLFVVAKAGTFLPPTPVNVTSSVVPVNVYNHYGVQFNWAWMAGATQYIIKRSVAISGKRYVTVGLTTSNSYFDVTPYPNGNYYYLIAAMDGNLEGVVTSEITVTTPAQYAPPNVLTSPTDLTNGAWVYPSGASALTATTVQCCSLTDTSKGDTFFDQNRVPIVANSNYIATMTVSAPVDCYVSMFIIDTNNIQIAVANKWILAGTLNNWRLSFSTFADIFQTTPFIMVGIDFDYHAASTVVTVTNLNVSMAMPQLQTNIFQSPTDLTNVAWTIANATMSAPLTMVCGSTVDVNNTCGSITQQPVAVDPNTDYVVTVTIFRTDADPSADPLPFTDYVDYMALSIYGQGFSSQLGSNVGSLINEGPTDLYVIFNSGANQNVIFGCATAPGAGSNLPGKTLVFSNINMQHNPYANADTVLLPRIMSVSFDTVNLVANQAVTGTLTLNRPAPTGGTQVALSSNTAVILPAAVTIPATATSVTFTCTANTVDRATTAIVLADYNSVHVTTKLYITPGLALANITVSPLTIRGGTTATGTVILSQITSSDFVVTLSSSSGSATVPATVTVPANSSTVTFTITTTAVSSLTPVSITGTNGGVTRTASMSIAISSNLSTVSVTPSTLVGGVIGSSTATGTVRLAASTSQPILVLLANSNPTVTVPVSVTIPQGAASATFPVTSTAVTSNQIAVITASYAGVSVTCQISVVPTVSIASFTIASNPVIGGNSTTGTVTLTTSAPVGGITISILSSSYVYAGMPASVAVAAGATSANFNITTQVVTAVQTATITVSYQSGSKALTFTMNPTATLSNLTTAASFVMNGGTTTGTVTIAGAAPSGGVSVSLSSSSSNLTVPSSVTVTSGNTTANFTITAASSLAADAAVTITATGNVSKTVAVDALSSSAQAAMIYAGMTGNSEGKPEGWPFGAPNYPGSLTQGNSVPTAGGNWHALTAWGVLYIGTSATAKSATNTRVNLRALQSWWYDNSVSLWKRIQFTNIPDSAAYWEDFHDDTNITPDVRTESDGTISATAGIGTNSSGTSLANRNFHFYPTDRGLFTYANYGGMFSMVQARLILGNASLTDDRAKSQYVLTCGADYWPNLTDGLPPGYDPEGDGANPGIGGSKYIVITNNWRTICMTTMSQAFLAANPPPIDLYGISL